jgi:SAM-dependent methyltransferase
MRGKAPEFYLPLRYSSLVVHDQLAYYEFFGFPSEWLRERYQPYAERFPVGARVLDVGCGRGEFLELLADRGIEAVGVDADPEMVGLARGKGLEVEQGDAIGYLEARSAAFDGVFAAHVVEHLPPVALSALVAAAAASLKPGGRIIVVSPNPGNLQMLMNDFWIDLQHVRFYHPEIIRFLLATSNMCSIEMGTNDRYQVGPAEITEQRDALPRDDERTRVVGHRLAHALAPTLNARLADVEERVNLLTTWARGLYAPGEYFVTAVR